MVVVEAVDVVVVAVAVDVAAVAAEAAVAGAWAFFLGAAVAFFGAAVVTEAAAHRGASAVTVESVLASFMACSPDVCLSPDSGGIADIYGLALGANCGLIH
jgi:hypothetical protein